MVIKRFVWGLSIVFVLLVGVLFFLPASSSRVSLVFTSDPLVLVSWDTIQSTYTVLVIPRSLEIPATHGYGWYSVSSLFSLDTMEKRKGALFLSTLDEVFTIPLHGYVVSKKSVGSTKEDIVRFTASSTSFVSLLSSFFSKQTTVSIRDLISFAKQSSKMGPDNVRVLDFRDIDIVSDVALPDGTLIKRFDTQKYDVQIHGTFEDVDVRQERLRVAIYNTTATVGIGQQVARIVEPVGGFVVFVGNDENVFSGICEIVVSKEHMKTKTVTYIQNRFGCQVKETTEELRGDVVIRLGSLFEKRYLPF